MKGIVYIYHEKFYKHYNYVNIVTVIYKKKIIRAKYTAYKGWINNKGRKKWTVNNNSHPRTNWVCTNYARTFSVSIVLPIWLWKQNGNDGSSGR